MRKTPLILLPLLLAGCVKQSASYYINDSKEHSLTVRVEQRYFWEDQVELTVVASRWPDCVRVFRLITMPVDEVVLELFDAGDNTYTLRSGTQLWQVETQTCSQKAAPAPEAMGDPVGVFRVGEGEKMDLELAKPAAPPPA
ncbi:MAG: hypothetical protein V4633_22155 [Pseudomonadota bacterium]